MSGVAHFEKRGHRGRKQHPKCPWCGRINLVTPRRIVKIGRTEFVQRWASHIFDCFPSTFPNREAVEKSFVHMADFGAVVQDNL